MSDCRKFEGFIQRELDGDLAEKDGRMLKMHLSKCDQCRSECEGYKAVRSLLKNTAPIETPPDLVARLTEGIEESPKAGFIDGILTPFLVQNKTRFAMASFVLVLATFGLFYNFYQQDQRNPLNRSGTTDYSDAVIGISQPGEPVYIIPASEDEEVAEENDAAKEELDRKVSPDYHESDIHLATD